MQCHKLANNGVKKVSVIFWPHTNAVTKHYMSVIINLRCGDSVCLCSIVCEEFAPLERRFVIDGAALIRSWRVTVLFCDSQSWSDVQLVDFWLLFIRRYLSFLYLFCSYVLKFNSLKPREHCVNVWLGSLPETTWSPNPTSFWSACPRKLRGFSSTRRQRSRRLWFRRDTTWRWTWSVWLQLASAELWFACTHVATFYTTATTPWPLRGMDGLTGSIYPFAYFYLLWRLLGICHAWTSIHDWWCGAD